MTGLIIFKTWFIITWNIGMILYEIPDKYVDIAIAVEYYKESTQAGYFTNQKSPCTESYSLLPLLVASSPLQKFRCAFGESTSCNIHRQRKLRKALRRPQSRSTFCERHRLEAFPQSIIAKFYFAHCPMKKCCWGVRFLDPAFDTLCGFPFIFFLVYLCYYGCITCKCCDKREEYGRREWLKNLCTCCICFGSVLFITFALSVMGLVFASLSLSEFSKRCS